MQCTACAADNPAGNKFCGQCGASLPLACPSCGAEVPPGNRFCGQCGSDLDSDASPEPSDAQPAAEVRSEAERRHLTVMFCDLADSTALSEQLDPEDLRDVVTAYQKVCVREIEDFGGFVARYMGDGILAYFGYPQAHENDAERAVHAGLNLVAAVTGLKPRPGLWLKVRVGIATGLVVAGDIIGEGASEERAVTGVTPNLAARLQGLAEADSVVISDATQRQAGGFFEYADLGRQTLKGISEPEQAWLVQGESAVVSRFEASAAAGLSPLVGREEEIALMLNRWQLTQNGEGQVVALSGEAGVGKSRIIQAFQARLEDDDHARIILSCSPFHTNSALYPVIGCLERVMGITRGDRTAERVAKIDAFVSELGLEAADITPYVASVMVESDAPPLPASADTPEKQRQLVWEALLTLLEAQSQRRPTVMIGEDIHWIDPSTEEFLGALVDRLRSLRLLLLTSSRPQYTPPWSGHPHITTLTLNRLSRAHSASLVAGVTGGLALPDEVLDQIVAKTDGVPLFVEELTKTVLESGIVKQAGNRYELTEPMASLAIPASLHDSLMARLDRLAPVKEVAQMASVLGRTFGEDVLLEVSKLGAEELRGALDQLIEAQLIVRRSHAGVVSYEFKHALVRETAYESLLKTTRQGFHLEFARVLEKLRNDEGGVEPEVLAHHFAEGGLAESAVAYWREAAQRATERWASAEAVSHVGKGLELLEGIAEGPDRAELELSLLRDLVGGLRILDRYQEALDMLARAQVVAEQHDLPDELAWVHYLRGNICFPLGDIDGCLAAHQKALEYARITNSTEMEARALSGLGDANIMRGDMTAAFDECVAKARQAGLDSVAAANLSMRGHARLYLLQIEEALADCPEAAELAVAEGNQRAEMIARGSCAGKVLFDMGNLAESRKQSEHAVAISKELGARRFEPVNQAVLAQILALEGDREGAEELARNAAQTSRETGLKFAGPMIMGALVQVTKSEEVRRSVIAECTAILSEGCVGHNYLWFYRGAMEAMLQNRNWEGVEAFAQTAEEYIADRSIPWLTMIVERARVLAAIGRDGANEQNLAAARDLAARARACGFLVIVPALETVLEAA